MSDDLPGFGHILLTREIWEIPALYICRFCKISISNSYCGLITPCLLSLSNCMLASPSSPASLQPLLIHSSLFTKLSLSPPLRETSWYSCLVFLHSTHPFTLFTVVLFRCVHNWYLTNRTYFSRANLV